MRTRFGKICSVLLLVSFITAGVSPACHFVSGKMMVEICTADGDIKTVEVPTENRQSRHAQKNAECMFCFAATNLQFFSAPETSVASLKGSHYLKLGSGSYVPTGLALKTYDPRGPPSSVV